MSSPRATWGNAKNAMRWPRHGLRQLVFHTRSIDVLYRGNNIDVMGIKPAYRDSLIRRLRLDTDV